VILFLDGPDPNGICASTPDESRLVYVGRSLVHIPEFSTCTGQPTPVTRGGLFVRGGAQCGSDGISANRPRRHSVVQAAGGGPRALRRARCHCYKIASKTVNFALGQIRICPRLALNFLLRWR